MSNAASVAVGIIAATTAAAIAASATAVAAAARSLGLDRGGSRRRQQRLHLAFLTSHGLGFAAWARHVGSGQSQCWPCQPPDFPELRLHIALLRAPESSAEFLKVRGAEARVRVASPDPAPNPEICLLSNLYVLRIEWSREFH